MDEGKDREMKLYFYFLETEKIRSEECEVEEKPKTYKPVNKFPSGYYGCYVKKEDIGKLIGYSENVVILTEENIQKAADVFRDKMRCVIARQKQNISSANDSINRCNETLSMIDEWERKMID